MKRPDHFTRANRQKTTAQMNTHAHSKRRRSLQATRWSADRINVGATASSTFYQIRKRRRQLLRHQNASSLHATITTYNKHWRGQNKVSELYVYTIVDKCVYQLFNIHMSYISCTHHIFQVLQISSILKETLFIMVYLTRGL